HSGLDKHFGVLRGRVEIQRAVPGHLGGDSGEHTLPVWFLKAVRFAGHGGQWADREGRRLRAGLLMCSSISSGSIGIAAIRSTGPALVIRTSFSKRTATPSSRM